MLKIFCGLLFAFVTGLVCCAELKDGQLIGEPELLTYGNFLNEVEKNNNELKSLQLKIDAEEGKIAEEERVYSYRLSVGGKGNLQSGKSKVLATYDTSISKMVPTGTQISLGLGTVEGKCVSIENAVPFMKIDQSLLRDIGGRCTKANIAKAKTRTKSVVYLLKYDKQKILLNAKLAYWNLSYAKTVVEFRKMSLERAKKILKWNKKRFDMDLTEKADLLQSQSAVKLKELSLKLAYEDESRARMAFNQFLNIEDGKIKYDVERFKDKKNNSNGHNTLNKKNTRMDVLAALEKVQESYYDKVSSKNRMGQDLIFNAGFAVNGLFYGEHFSFRSNRDKLSLSIGLRYTLPLDFQLRKIINQGYNAAEIASQRSADFAVLKEKNEWLQLTNDWTNAKMRFDLALEIENVQQQRHEEGKSLLRRGRSTTHLVLQIEQDLDDATLSVLQSIFELIKIREQVETFYN
jgi:outer membrane protein TolC